MLAEWSAAKTLALIRTFRKHPALWNPSDKSFRNRDAKAAAWVELSASVGERVDQCKRKVGSLFASCRRERSKISKSRAEGSVYVPSWPLWKEFAFMRSEPNAGADRHDDDSERPCSAEENISDDDAPLEPKTEELSPLFLDVDADADASSEACGSFADYKREDSIAIERDRGKSRSRKIMNDEYSAIGVIVKNKLRKMNPTQRLFAENLINQTLFKGLMCQLTADDCITQKTSPTFS